MLAEWLQYDDASFKKVIGFTVIFEVLRHLLLGEAAMGSFFLGNRRSGHFLADKGGFSKDYFCSLVFSLCLNAFRKNQQLLKESFGLMNYVLLRL